MALNYGVKRGDLVEFTDRYYQHYPPDDTSVIRYGVACEDEQPVSRTVAVVLVDRSVVVASHIHAYAWAGWMPEGLEDIWIAMQPADDFDECD